MYADPILTADDIVRAGACSDGVADFVKKNAKRLAAAMPASAILALVSGSQREYVVRAANLDGSGDGYGYGDGDGYGYGSGSGYGSGDGYGDGE